MQMLETRDTIIPMRDGFACCPQCGSKLIRITSESEGYHLPIWCRKCKREILIDIHRGQSFISRSPDQSSAD